MTLGSTPPNHIPTRRRGGSFAGHVTSSLECLSNPSEQNLNSVEDTVRRSGLCDQEFVKEYEELPMIFTSPFVRHARPNSMPWGLFFAAFIADTHRAPTPARSQRGTRGVPQDTHTDHGRTLTRAFQGPLSRASSKRIFFFERL